jgi:hypothetical protein
VGLARCTAHRQLPRLSDEGYRFENTDEDSYWVYRSKAGYCLALRAMKRARPAVTSYLRDFRFTQDVLEYLPALVDAAGCKYLRAQLLANWDGVPWSSSEMTRKYDEDAFSIIGHGDFNEDGLDDLLVRRDFLGFVYDKPRGLPQTVLFLLTRDREGPVLRVIDAHGYRGGKRKSCLNAETLSYY